MERSLQILRPFGRFLELGKRDFYAGSRLGLRPFRQNISFYGIDADQLHIGCSSPAALFREMVSRSARDIYDLSPIGASTTRKWCKPSG